ncbi:DUF2147 domain-containing protein [Rhodanobacter denitrificans]|uniref:DUF2147 domain-containing protein n=1 Tax=Rhodanobacter denitrificans TaxID=666685 RepID=I4WLC7_9GAMM|nr:MULTISPECIES: DUF2147 domain-containing protein [Rhodanobacter]AGG88474.1 hypothetical protein R2APBS1_1323 [Rhodanobacter denitrificans]EIM00269.1 hypothetical protein UUC_13625 [Rhodanobacter denitrificans]UJJ58857.1 DUF2147 domain-containing protein [Rhodanobacter denitrificans]UJM87610.1 DUF2147 domain-containing protein [Rhodanobacter denitrificans]UJM89323.1 DUF2147 domain-containing protein [Rhodanobacter denitrificans]
MKQAVRLTFALGLLLAAGAALAANNTPVGTWKTIDDKTHQPKSIVEITEHNGEYRARIVELLNRTPEDVARDGEHPLCTQCEGERKNQPIVGMTFMWGVSQDGDEWSGGKILDPKDGKIYKVKLTMMDDGQKLNVRGYIGFSWVGRTQIWERQP